jgi:hypothetical protein
MERSNEKRSWAASRAGASLAGAVALTCACLLLGLASGAGAQAGRTTVVLGAGPLPSPACPQLPCLAIGRVSGFQARTPERNLPFRVTRAGEITAWSISLAFPSNKQRSFFNDFFRPPPEARIAILKRVPGTSPPRYKLRRQSPIRVLTPYLGQRVRFGLARGLPVRPGNIVALTVPTWAPAFGITLPAKNVWRASRHAGRCRDPRDLRRSRPQQVPDSKRAYGCRYRGYRLLYTATLDLQP